MKKILYLLILTGIARLSAFYVTPTAYVGRLSGNNVVSSNSAFLIVIENPSNSGEPILSARVLLNSYSGGSISSLRIYGDAAGTTSFTTSPVPAFTIDFSSNYLKPGCAAYLTISGTANPSSAGMHYFTVKITGTSGTEYDAPAKPGKMQGFNITGSSGFRNRPYARVFMHHGFGGVTTGSKVISITGNHYVQTIYNPHDSGADIDEIVLEIPLPYATVASINFTGTNITTGAQILDFQPGAIAANVKKVFYLTLSAPIKPGETGVIYLRSLSNPAVANNATNQFFLFTKNTVSGGICLAADMPGFPGAQTITNIAALPTVELYASVTPGFNLAAGTLGWPTAGYSNNSLHFQIVGNRVWSTTWTNRTSNENFDFSSAGVGFEATNAAGASNVFISNNCFWFKMHLVSVAGHSKYVTITNVVNAATAGSYQFYSAYSNNFTRTCAQTNEYNSTIRIVDHLFNATPAAGIFLSGGSNAPASRGYYTLVLHNPTNSGDAVDKIVFTLPAGFTAESVSAADAWFSYSAASLSSVTASGQTITAYFNAANPLGEGGTIFLPVRVSHPASAGAYAMSVTCSGLRDVYNLSCSYSLPAEISGYFDASQYIQVPAGMYADVNNYISASIGGSVKSGDQKCVVTFQTNGLSGTSIVSVVEKDVALPAYIRRVSKIYDINSSAALTKPATIKIIFTRPEAVEKLAQKFTLAYYESVSQKWVTVPTTIDMANTNASAQTMHFSPWALIEDRASLSNAVIDNLFAYPNPFSGETKAKISFSLGQASKIYLSIYDQHNRRVINLANGEPYEASFQEFTWNGKNAYGKDLPNGIYFINLKVEPSGEGYENTVKTAKLILSR